MTCNLNLLCKDGYIISLALFVETDSECLLSMSEHNLPLWTFVTVLYELYFPFAQKDGLYNALELSAPSVLELTVC